MAEWQATATWVSEREEPLGEGRCSRRRRLPRLARPTVAPVRVGLRRHEVFGVPDLRIEASELRLRQAPVTRVAAGALVEELVGDDWHIASRHMRLERKKPSQRRAPHR